MMQRRAFMQLGLSVTAGSFLPLQAGALTPAPGRDVSLFRLLHDTRQQASLARTRALGELMLGPDRVVDALLQPLHGDLTRFWYDELQPLWQHQRVALAGSTAPDLLFCLEQLARDHGLRVLWREQQAVESGPPLVSWLIAAA